MSYSPHYSTEAWQDAAERSQARADRRRRRKRRQALVFDAGAFVLMLAAVLVWWLA